MVNFDQLKTKIVVLGFIACMACGGDSKPDYILEEEQMVELLLEVHLGQTRVNELRLKKDSAQWVYGQYQGARLDSAGVSDSVFYESLRYYMDRPADMDRIHEAVLDTLNLRLDKIEAQEEKDRKEKEEEREEEDEKQEATPIKSA